MILIEAIILVPSAHKRKGELLDQLKEISSAKVSMVMAFTPPAIADEALLQRLMVMQSHPYVLGGTLYRADGVSVGSFGEAPELNFGALKTGGPAGIAHRNPRRYDVVCLLDELSPSRILILRHDATWVQHELYAFILRIAGLVVIISLFVTVGAWVALDPIVVTPILNLRRDLITAGEAIVRDAPAPAFYAATVHRQDELGEVITAFNRMYGQISEAIEKRKDAETALKESLQQVEAYSATLGKELDQGRQMQRNFLPRRLPQNPGWEIAAFFEPARQVAGDFYDVFELPGSRIGLVIADVCDKGVGAALFMALFRSLIRIFSGQSALEGVGLPRPEIPLPGQAPNPCQNQMLRAVSLTNDYIAQNHSDLGMFATLFFGVLEAPTGKLTYINGGHEPPLIVAGGAVKRVLSPTGPAVGMWPQVAFQRGEAILAPGEALVGYTDGVTEAHSPGGEMFGKQRLLDLVAGGSSSAADLVERLRAQLYAHIGDAQPFDDISLIVVQRRPEKKRPEGLGKK
ncbi:MAG TPA: SpoIIE family protein phosphatase [Desulfobacterales bacterium]|nr:SpoIIE family protein phosphatase [Desulfobacterales bacterium]